MQTIAVTNFVECMVYNSYCQLNYLHILIFRRISRTKAFFLKGPSMISRIFSHVAGVWFIIQPAL